MGLDLSRELGHERARFAYSGFAEFRRRLAANEGIDLDAMEGFTANGRSWAEQTSSLVPLLSHSDCDGELSTVECGQISIRLRDAVTETFGSDFPWVLDQAMELVELIEEAYINNDRVLFH